MGVVDGEPLSLVVYTVRGYTLGNVDYMMTVVVFLSLAFRR